MKPLNVHEAKTHLSRLLDRAHAGEEIVIAKGGQPYARLGPVSTRPAKRERGTLKGSVVVTASFFDSLPSGWTGED